MEIKTLDEKERCSWDDFVNRHENGKFVHLSAFKNIVEKTYNYKSHFLYACENGKILSVFPFFCFKDILFRKKFTSQPFSEYGGILFEKSLNEKQKTEIILKFKEYLKKIFPKEKNISVEIHGQQDQAGFLQKHLIKKPLYKIAVLKLGPYGKIYENFDYQIKKAIKKSEKEKVIIREETSPESIKNKFYPLYANYLKKKHGTPSFPLEFFMNCYRYAPQNIKLFIAEFNNRIVAALWGYLTGQNIQISYNPSLEKYLDKRPNDSLHNEFIKWACNNNFKYFDFGPARYQGQIYFKEKWGVEFRNYSYFYVSDKRINPRPYTAEAKSLKLLSFFWKNLVPNCIAKSLGPFLRKKMGK